MEITGKIIAVLPEQGGVSKNGNEWKKQEYVLETHDQYPKKVCFQLFGADRIAQAAIQPGEELTVSFDIEAVNIWENGTPTSMPGSRTSCSSPHECSSCRHYT